MSATETLDQEYDRLFEERGDLIAAVRDREPTPEESARFRAVMARLRAILATPPPGYALPTQAAALTDHARAHGWHAAVQWTPPGWDDEVHVKVSVSRHLTEQEARDARGSGWGYVYTWHARGCQPGRLRLFGAGQAQTPDAPWAHPAPSLRAVREVIAARPAPA
jgi:hypothetical protein